MTTEVTTQTLAEEALDWFETATRGDNEDRFVRLKDGAPEWLTELVHSAHGDFLPDDWRYEKIRAAVEWIRDNDDADPGDFADDAVDVYTGARLAWLSSNLRRPGYCDEADAEFDGPGGDIIQLIGMGQYVEASEIFGLVMQALEERVAELEPIDA